MRQSWKKWFKRDRHTKQLEIVADTLTKEQRSERMARVRSRDTKPELLVRKYLFKQGFRYRIHDKGLPGSPDIVLPKYRTVVFVHGCFWHRHEGCRLRTPKSRVEFWESKFEENKKRDIRNQQNLKTLGWRVLLVHECELARSKQDVTLKRLSESIKE